MELKQGKGRGLGGFNGKCPPEDEIPAGGMWADHPKAWTSPGSSLLPQWWHCCVTHGSRGGTPVTHRSSGGIPVTHGSSGGTPVTHGGSSGTPVSPMGAVVTLLSPTGLVTVTPELPAQAPTEPWGFWGGICPEKHFPSPKGSWSTSRALQIEDFGVEIPPPCCDGAAPEPRTSCINTLCFVLSSPRGLQAVDTDEMRSRLRQVWQDEISPGPETFPPPGLPQEVDTWLLHPSQGHFSASQVLLLQFLSSGCLREMLNPRPRSTKIFCCHPSWCMTCQQCHL